MIFSTFLGNVFKTLMSTLQSSALSFWTPLVSLLLLTNKDTLFQSYFSSFFFCPPPSPSLLFPFSSIDLSPPDWMASRRDQPATLLYSTAIYCTALCYIALHCTLLYCTALYYTALDYTTLHCTILHYTALNCATMHCTITHPSTLLLYSEVNFRALHYISLHYISLHYISLHYISLHF